MWTYDPICAALTTQSSSMNTWSPICKGKKATLMHTQQEKFNHTNSIRCFTLHQQHCSPFAEFLEGRSDHTATLNDTVAPNSDISEISSDDTVIHHDGLEKKRTFHTVITQLGKRTRRNEEEKTHFSIENNVLTAAKNRLSADFVAWCLERSKAQVTITWRSSSGLMYLKTPRANDTDVYWLASYDKLTLLCWRVIFV